MYVVIVQIHVEPTSIDAFIAATRDNHLGTRGEPGNLRFDVLRRADDPNRFVLYEVYVDEADFAAHQRTAHYVKWRDAVAPMMAEPRSPNKCHSLFPEPWA
ncbi:MAG TPA: antibiotic biosynthesis monooxygenase [Polyangiaceae bacterium]|nr:antibiotic biosynthesis monooxygenase [Polyangiaceae bacterium]